MLGRQSLTEESSAEIYEGTWNTNMLSQFDLTKGKTGPVLWNGQWYYANKLVPKRIPLLYLMRLIETLKPERVLEVGAGMGFNLIILAQRFPHIHFEGIELTANGVATANELRSSSEFLQAIEDFSPLPLIDRDAQKRIVFQQGSAASLPYPAASFDLVFTIQALEQMESIRKPALSEIARVGRYAAMFEPFSGMNRAFFSRIRVLSRDYFRGRVSDLKEVGLDPMWSNDKMPSKLDYNIGLVVSRSVQNQPASNSAIMAA